MFTIEIIPGFSQYFLTCTLLITRQQSTGAGHFSETTIRIYWITEHNIQPQGNGSVTNPPDLCDDTLWSPTWLHHNKRNKAIRLIEWHHSLPATMWCVLATCAFPALTINYHFLSPVLLRCLHRLRMFYIPPTFVIIYHGTVSANKSFSDLVFC